ncbi:unnamed protein product, partial [Meganyctiphanes norvegica]
LCLRRKQHTTTRLHSNHNNTRMLHTAKYISILLRKNGVGINKSCHNSTRNVSLAQIYKMGQSSIFVNEMSTNSSSQTATLPSEADVVVVGGGIMGCFILYHLAKLGVTSAVLLERDRLTCGT